MNYQFVDSVGIHATASIIKQSGLQKLSIQKYGAAKGSLPVFEDVSSKTNDRVVKSFTDWAGTILQGNPYNDTVYEAVLFNEVDNDDEETEGAPVKRGYAKRNKMKFAFQLFRAGQGESKQEVTGQPMSNEATIQALYQKLKDDEVLKRLEALEKRLDEYEEEEEEEAQAGGVSEQSMATIEKFIGLLSQKNTKQQVNGTDERDTKEVTANINKAVKILWQYDKQLDKHLLKLANMAENNNALFNQVISQLDLM